MKTSNFGFAGVLVVILSLPLLGGCGPHQIPPSSVGVKFSDRTGISNTLLKPQVVWLGFYDRLIIYPTSIKNASYVRTNKEGEAEGDDSIQVSTKEGALLPMDVTVAYYVSPDHVLKAFQELGTSDIDTIQNIYVRWATIYAMNVVGGRNSIFDLISKDRATVGPQVKAVLSPILADWGITVEGVYIGEVYPNEEINAKIAESISVRNDLEKAKVEKQRAIVEARTTITNAEKVAAQNKQLATLGSQTLRQKKLEIRRAAIAKWNGESPIIGDNKVPFTSLTLGN